MKTMSGYYEYKSIRSPNFGISKISKGSGLQ